MWDDVKSKAKSASNGVGNFFSSDFHSTSTGKTRNQMAGDEAEARKQFNILSDMALSSGDATEADIAKFDNPYGGDLDGLSAFALDTKKAREDLNIASGIKVAQRGVKKNKTNVLGSV